MKPRPATQLVLALGLMAGAGCYQVHERRRGDAADDDGGRDALARPDAFADDAGPARACGTSTCGPGEICITGRCGGCCDLPPACIPIPAGCAGALACDCFASDPCGGCTRCRSARADEIVCGDCTCTCAAPWTPIEVPGGTRRIADLRAGDPVFSIDHGERRVVPLARVGRRAVRHHAIVRITLASGDVIEMSGPHPSADGRRFDALAPGDRLGDAIIESIETVPYDEPFTYDILPASDTGTYFVGGAAIGSTLFVGAGGV